MMLCGIACCFQIVRAKNVWSFHPTHVEWADGSKWVGISRAWMHGNDWETGLSHMRGNESYYPQLDSIIDAFIPHALEWNWTLDINVLTVNDGPTRVGVNLVQRLQKWVELCLSHTSGSESYQRESFSERIRLVPHTWEWIGKEVCEACELWGCPTQVGMNRGKWKHLIIRDGLFHTCGNVSGGYLIKGIAQQFAPH